MFFKDYKNHQNAKIRESLFWEYRIADFDFELMRDIVIQRVIERGRMDDFYAMFNLYGINCVKRTVKELPYLNDKDIAFVCTVLNLKKENLRCYSRKQSEQLHWNS